MIPKCARRTIQKRSFLLFELLVSLALVLLCFFPLVRSHTAMRKNDIRHLEEIQLERVAQAAFCHIKTRLYQANVHPWGDLFEQACGEVEEEEHEFSICTGKNKTKTFTCHYTIDFLDKVNKSSQKKVGVVIQITMHFFPSIPQTPYVRTLYLEQYWA